MLSIVLCLHPAFLVVQFSYPLGTTLRHLPSSQLHDWLGLVLASTSLMIAADMVLMTALEVERVA